jgi:TIR domain
MGVGVARVFVSHALEDRVLADYLRHRLTAEGHEIFVDDDAHGLIVGEDWKQRLYVELRYADVMVCLVSMAYLSSTWCAVEVGIADSMGIRILPLRVNSDVTHPLLADRHHLDISVDSSDAWASRLVMALRRLDTSGVGRWGATNPFPGLAPFTVEMAPAFFGRSAETQDLARRLRAHSHAGGGGLLAVIGPSGSGKSSLLRAGLLPLLAREPGWLVVSPWSPGLDPVAELARAVTSTGRGLGLGWSMDHVHRVLGRPDGLRRLADELLSAREGRDPGQLLVSVDQAEELLTLSDVGTRDHVVALFREAIADPTQIIVTVRSAFLDDLVALFAAAAVPVDGYLLPPLARDLLPLIIEGPARVAGLRVEPELVARLVADTGGADALPLLAFTLHQLAADLHRGGVMSAERYERIGGVHAALMRQADAALAEGAARAGLTQQDVLAGLVRLATVDDAGHPFRRRIEMGGLPDRLRAAFEAFVARRLLITGIENSRVWITPAHQAFLTAWPPLEAAIADKISALRIALSIERGAADWVAAGRPNSFLWDKERVASALAVLEAPNDPSAWTTGLVADLSEDALAFLLATHRRNSVARPSRWRWPARSRWLRLPRGGGPRFSSAENPERPVLRLSDVFRPVGLPEVTFVEPRDYAAFRLAISQPGIGVVLEGPSGIGKTTMLKRAVEHDKMGVGYPRILSARIPADVEEINSLPDEGHQGIVAVDDFHRLPVPSRDRLTDYLKRLADNDTAPGKLVIVGIPGTAQSLVDLSFDVANRIRVFRLGRAEEGRIRELIEKGEVALNIVFEQRPRIVRVSAGSLVTAQSLCSHLATMADIERTAPERTVVRTDVREASLRVAEELRIKYQEMASAFASLDEPAEDTCIEMLLGLAQTEDGVLRLDSFLSDNPQHADVIERVFPHPDARGTERDPAISRHLYYDPRGRRLVADDPQLIFYLRQLRREDLLTAAGKRLPAPRKQIFICYSHRDAYWRDRLLTHLRLLERRKRLDIWSDQRIEIGDDWLREIGAALDRARFALLLISADFLASDFIQEVELPTLLARAHKGGCTVLPILARPSAFEQIAELSRFKYANPDRTTLATMPEEAAEEVLADVTRRILRLVGD